MNRGKAGLDLCRRVYVDFPLHFSPMRVFFLLAAAVLLHGCRVAAPAATAPPEAPPWVDLGGFLLSDERHAIQHSARGADHRLELQRIVQTRNLYPIRWETTDIVNITLDPDLFLCLTPARAADGADVVVIYREDESHRHEARYAWDVRGAKLVAVDPAGLVCDVDECDDDDDQ